MLATMLTFHGFSMCMRTSGSDKEEEMEEKEMGQGGRLSKPTGQIHVSKSVGMTDITKEKGHHKEIKACLKKMKGAERERKNILKKQRKQFSKEKLLNLYDMQAMENENIYKKEQAERKKQSPPGPNVPVFDKCPRRNFKKEDIHRAFKELARKIDAMSAWDEAALRHARSSRRPLFATPLFRNSEAAANFDRGRAINGHESKPIENMHDGVVVGCDRVAASLDRHLAPGGLLKTTSSTSLVHSVTDDDDANVQYVLKVHQLSSPALQFV